MVLKLPPVYWNISLHLGSISTLWETSWILIKHSMTTLFAEPLLLSSGLPHVCTAYQFFFFFFFFISSFGVFLFILQRIKAPRYKTINPDGGLQRLKMSKNASITILFFVIVGYQQCIQNKHSCLRIISDNNFLNLSNLNGSCFSWWASGLLICKLETF